MARKNPETFKITVKNWEKWNPSPNKTTTYFRFSNNFFEDPIIAQLSTRQQMTFVFILTRCSIMRTSSVLLCDFIVTSSVPHRGVMVTSTLSKLSELGLIDLQKERKKEKKDNTFAHSPQAAKMSVLNFEAVYERYPRKIGKQAGFKKLEKIIKTESDLENFKKAVENFREAMAKEKREVDKIPYFSTFVNSQWQDFLANEKNSTEYLEDQKQLEIEKSREVWGDV